MSIAEPCDVCHQQRCVCTPPPKPPEGTDGRPAIVVNWKDIAAVLTEGDRLSDEIEKSLDAQRAAVFKADDGPICKALATHSIADVGDEDMNAQERVEALLDRIKACHHLPPEALAAHIAWWAIELDEVKRALDAWHHETDCPQNEDVVQGPDAQDDARALAELALDAGASRVDLLALAPQLERETYEGVRLAVIDHVPAKRKAPDLAISVFDMESAFVCARCREPLVGAATWNEVKAKFKQDAVGGYICEKCATTNTGANRPTPDMRGALGFAPDPKPAPKAPAGAFRLPPVDAPEPKPKSLDKCEECGGDWEYQDNPGEVVCVNGHVEALANIRDPKPPAKCRADVEEPIGMAGSDDLPGDFVQAQNEGPCVVCKKLTNEVQWRPKTRWLHVACAPDSVETVSKPFKPERPKVRTLEEAVLSEETLTGEEAKGVRAKIDEIVAETKRKKAAKKAPPAPKKPSARSAAEDFS